MSASAVARVAGGATELAPVPEAPRHADTLELRLALVCYGGVSLAIYMHGVTKEIQKLVAASAAYERDQSACPWDESQTEHAYWHALAQREQEDPKHLRTRVVVDIVAGTSAGGINGIILAKALAHDLPQDALRDVWLGRGDIKQLMANRAARAVPFLALKFATWGAWSLLTRAKPPLDGDRMFKWIHGALEEMDAAGGNGASLMPPMHRLELYVTVTDFNGYNRRVPTYDPRRVSDLRHRHALVFTYGPERDQLDETYNAELAFAARATSCFPGAFPPINIANIAHNVPGWDGAERFKREFWSIYPLSDANVEDTHFVDGGVLDNFPFGHAIQAIRRRPASVQVDRRLVFIEPDPKGRSEAPAGEAPSLTGTVWGGLSGIPGHEPVLDDLLTVRELNERVDRVREIVAAALPRMPAPATNGAGPASYAEANAAANQAAAEQAGFAYTTYIQLKLHSVVERFAAIACRVLDFPLDSNQAFFVRDVLVEWARQRGILAAVAEASEVQRGFLRDFDLDYAERRIRFAVSYVSGLYGEPGGPPREELNRAKQALYEHVGELARAADSVGTDGRDEALKKIFDPERVRAGIDGDESPDEAVATLPRARGRRARRDPVGTAPLPGQRLGDFGEKVYATLLELSANWDERTRRELLDRYIGFPLWDVLIFPLQAVADIGELNRVEVMRFSPEDVKLLQPPTAEKLKGVAAGHFAAFFSRDRRENDYLWGRLDAAERIVGLVLGSTPPALCGQAFKAILDQEEPELKTISGLFEGLREQLPS